LICETGNNSRALRPEFIDLHIQEEQPTTEAVGKTIITIRTIPIYFLDSVYNVTFVSLYWPLMKEKR
jgi:hypothetical protein